ncbi:MAG: nitrogen fixation protein NifB [Paenibacillaceae bacterium]|nr:nitrogen fixation protein NifB [Paenibacillaceae bacterium]
METALIADHPCYQEKAHHHYARMHAPVAPKCNISCHYCNPRFDCANESRPGVTSRVLSPEEALTRTADYASRLQNLTVLGIAGPGDPLANPEETFSTFRLVKEAFPKLHLCLSTNGLMLPEYVDEIRALGVRHVTLTMNAVDARIGSRIYAHVRYGGQVYRGLEAASLLLERQLEGIRRLAGEGVLCKINSVLIPGINDRHLLLVSETAKRLGAFSHNIMPLILSPGSRFHKDGVRAPEPSGLSEVRDACSVYMPQMRHCRQCRADAVGLLGDVRSQEAAGDREAAATEERGGCFQPRTAGLHPAEAAASGTPGERSDWSRAVRVAVASRGMGQINLHFGHATEFLIYDVAVAEVRLAGVRKVQAYCNGTADCAPDGKRLAMEETMELLADCRLLLSSGIGPKPQERLQKAGIIPLVRKGPIEENAVECVRLMKYFL